VKDPNGWLTAKEGLPMRTVVLYTLTSRFSWRPLGQPSSFSSATPIVLATEDRAAIGG
jgi:hypothetical protein